MHRIIIPSVSMKFFPSALKSRGGPLQHIRKVDFDIKSDLFYFGG